MADVVLAAFRTEFARYRAMAEKALAQVEDAGFDVLLDERSNSIGVIVQHVGGNLRSRFTDFLTADGEKPWRDRDGEFDLAARPRADRMATWAAGWAAVEGALGELGDEDLSREVAIRGVSLTVAEALARSVAHTASHVGQLVLLARHVAGERWQTLSIPRGGSGSYNENPDKEKGLS